MHSEIWREIIRHRLIIICREIYTKRDICREIYAERYMERDH